MLPSFFTEHENMTAASFCPCFIKPAVSMRLINESAPLPRRMGRYIGKPDFCAEGISTCDQPRSTTTIKIAAVIPQMRMKKICNRNGRRFQPQFQDLCGRFVCGAGRNLLHDLVALKIIDHRIARPHWVKGAAHGRIFEKSAQFHKTMTAAA